MTENRNPLLSLVRDLLKEPFATKHGFVNETMEGTARHLEAEPTSEDPSTLQSYERCKAIFCMLLLELENDSADLATRTLGEFASGQPTATESAAPVKPAVSTPAIAAEKTPPPVPEKKTATASAPAFTSAPVSAAGSTGVVPRLTHPVASEYFWLAESLKAWEVPGREATKPLVRRLATQQLCFALELEAQAKLAPGLGTLGAERLETIRKVLVAHGPKIEFSDEIKKLIERVEKDYARLLHEGKFPALSMMNALKYLQSLKALDGFRPSLMESGTLLFFFALPKPTEASPISNLLHAGGINPAKVLELALRLSRVQKLRGTLFDPASKFEDKHETQIREDILQSFALLDGLHTGAVMPLKKAG